MKRRPLAPPHKPPQSATDSIVRAVLDRSSKPAPSDIERWLEGGAAFWSEEHFVIGVGYDLSVLFETFVDEEGCLDNPQKHEVVNRFVCWLRAGEDSYVNGWQRWKYGSIPLLSTAGQTVFAISHFTSFTGDRLVGFFKSERAFKLAMRITGFVWIDERGPTTDGLRHFTDEELARRFLSSKRFAKRIWGL